MTDHDAFDGPGVLAWAKGFDVDQLPPTSLIEPAVDTRAGELTGSYPFGWTARDAAHVAESWRRQVLLFDVDGSTVRVQARLEVNGYAGVRGDQGSESGVWPLTGDVLIAGSVRGPATYLFDEQLTSRDVLHHQATTFLVSARGAILVDRGHQWAEPAVIATGPASTEAPQPDWQECFMDVCHQLGIDTIVRVRDGFWQVLTLRGGGGNQVHVLSSDPCSITRDVERRCVMLPAPEAGQYCRMHGGPWTSESLQAASAWKAHRAQIGAALGCHTCEGKRYVLNGRVMKGGGPVSVVNCPVPTRWLEPHDVPIAMEEG